MGQRRVTHWWRSSQACATKVRHDSIEAAKEELWRLIGAGAKDAEQLVVYQCVAGDHFHVGHGPSGTRLLTKSANPAWTVLFPGRVVYDPRPSRRKIS